MLQLIAAELVRSIKNSVILITMNEQSEVIKLADRTFLVHGEENNLKQQQ